MTRDAYIDTRSNVILTTSIYDAKTEQLVWVGRSKSFEVRLDLARCRRAGRAASSRILETGAIANEKIFLAQIPY
jgi:hypothetical protein